MLSPSHEPRPNVMSAVASFIEFPVRHEYDGQLDYHLFGGVAKFGAVAGLGQKQQTLEAVTRC
jgi:hypothetical protein